MLRLFLCYSLFATAAPAQDRMDASSFDAYVTGRTLTYRYPDGSTGTEAYLSDRRVMWSSRAGVCQYGVWYESKGDICFRYDHDPLPKCWTVYNESGGLRSIYTTAPPYTVIHEMLDRTDPLICNDLSS